VIGLVVGRFDLCRLLRRTVRPSLLRYVLPFATVLKGLLPVGIVQLLAPGPTLPFVVALLTTAAHFFASGRVYILWLLLGATLGLQLPGLALAIAALAVMAMYYPNESLVLPAGLLIAGSVLLAPGWFREDVHIAWTFAVLAASLGYLARGFIRRHRSSLTRLRTLSYAALAMLSLVAAQHIHVGRQGFAEMVECQQIVSGPPSLKAVALTFDDGPDPKYTPQVLKVLKEHNVRATFFMVGSKVLAHPDIARQIVADGHAVGNHSYTHRDLGKLSREQLAKEIDWTSKAIEEVCGIRPTMFRPPRGVTSPTLLRLLAERKMVLALWTTSSGDWMQLSPGSIVKRLSRHVAPGEVFLFHDSGDFISAGGASRLATVKCLPGVIKAVRQANLGFACMFDVYNAAREAGWYAGIPIRGAAKSPIEYPNWASGTR
jgi:peptidoglycan/xylan/chitin deacetylase (PgdA/CDA1 family)